MDLLKKACSFCIYQERTQEEVRQKLHSFGASDNETEEIISWLITENFINEERYAKQFAGGKFRVKKWGRKKILFELKSKGLSPYCITEAMKEIPDEDYYATIVHLIQSKWNSQIPPILAKKKVINYLIGKGYEYADIQIGFEELEIH